ncbi:hypothetical protein [Pseudomonas sp. H2_D02]
MEAFLTSDISKVALGGAIAISGQLMVFLLGWAKEHLVTRRKRELEAQHLGMRVVLALEKLVGDAYSAVNDQTYTDETGRIQDAVVNPDFSLPQDGDYRAFPTTLMYDVMSMPSRMDAVRGGLSDMRNFASPPDYFEYYLYRQESLSKLALKALELIESLCKRYRIPPPERAEHYEPKQVFLRELGRTDRAWKGEPQE